MAQTSLKVYEIEIAVTQDLDLTIDGGSISAPSAINLDVEVINPTGIVAIIESASVVNVSVGVIDES